MNCSRRHFTRSSSTKPPRSSCYYFRISERSFYRSSPRNSCRSCSRNSSKIFFRFSKILFKRFFPNPPKVFSLLTHARILPDISSSISEVPSRDLQGITIPSNTHGYTVTYCASHTCAAVTVL